MKPKPAKRVGPEDRDPWEYDDDDGRYWYDCARMHSLAKSFIHRIPPPSPNSALLIPLTLLISSHSPDSTHPLSLLL